MFYGNDPRPGDNQEHPIKVEKDEYVVNRNAARKHRSLLDYINFVDEPRYDNKEMAHSSIDEAIALNTLSGMQEGGSISKGLNQLLNLQELYAGEGPRTQSGDLKFGKEGMMTREGLADEYNFPLEEASFDTLYGLPGSENMGIDISIPSQKDNIEYRRSGNMSEKVGEFMFKKQPIKSEMLRDFEGDYQELSSDIASDDYSGAIEKVKAGYLNMNPLEQARYDRSLRTPKPTAEPAGPSRAEKLQQMKALNMSSEEEFDKFMEWKKSMGMQEGGDVDFPVTNESIGAVDSLASYMSKFNKDIDFMGYGDEEAGILEQFGRPEFRRAGRTAQDEGFIMNEEEIGKALNYLAKRHQEKTLGMGVRGMQDGGSTYGYGSQVSTSPTFEDLYAYAGIEPSPEQRAKFEGNFRYDPSREEGTIADYMRGVENLQDTGQNTLRSAGVTSRAAGAGFGGFGKREEMQDLAGSAARSEYSSGLGQAQQDRFESIRGQRESWMTDAMGELGRIEELGGTDVYEEPTETPNFLTGQGDSNPEGWTGGTPTAGTNFTDTNGVSWRFVDIPGVGGLWQEQT